MIDLTKIVPDHGSYYIIEKRLKDKLQYRLVTEYNREGKFIVRGVLETGIGFTFSPKIGNSIRPINASMEGVLFLVKTLTREKHPEYFL